MEPVASPDALVVPLTRVAEIDVLVAVFVAAVLLLALAGAALLVVWRLRARSNEQER